MITQPLISNILNYIHIYHINNNQSLSTNTLVNGFQEQKNKLILGLKIFSYKKFWFQLFWINVIQFFIDMFCRLLCYFFIDNVKYLSQDYKCINFNPKTSLLLWKTGCVVAVFWGYLWKKLSTKPHLLAEKLNKRNMIKYKTTRTFKCLFT